MAVARLQGIRSLHRALQPLPLSPFSGIYRSYLNALSEGITRQSIIACSYPINDILGQNVSELAIHFCGTRWMSMMKMPRGARQTALKVTMLSPGFVYEPYEPQEPIPFWKSLPYKILNCGKYTPISVPCHKQPVWLHNHGDVHMEQLPSLSN